MYCVSPPIRNAFFVKMPFIPGFHQLHHSSQVIIFSANYIDPQKTLIGRFFGGNDIHLRPQWMEAFQDLWSPPFQRGYYQLCPPKKNWNQMNHPGSPDSNYHLKLIQAMYLWFIPKEKKLSLYVLVVSPRLGDSKTPRDLVMTHPVVMPIGGW